MNRFRWWGRLTAARRRVGSIGLRVEPLEARALLHGSGGDLAVFVPPDVADLIRAARAGQDVAPAASRRMLAALRSQVKAGPLEELELGQIDGHDFAHAVDAMVAELQEALDQTPLPGRARIATQGNRLRDLVAALDQQVEAGLISDEDLALRARVALEGLGTRPPADTAGRFRAVVERTRSFVADLRATARRLGDFTADPLGVEEADRLLTAGADAYRASMAGLLRGDSAASRYLEAAITDLQRQSAAIVEGDAPNGKTPQARFITAVSVFENRVLGTTGLLGPRGAVGSRFSGRAPGRAADDPPPPPPVGTPTPTPGTVPDVPQEFLFTPITDLHGASLVTHVHPRLTILVDGQSQTIPATVGNTPAGLLPLHTHDTTGTIHLESTRRFTFRLRDFFTVWSRSVNDPSIVFNRRTILGRTVDANHRIRMTVDGRESAEFEDLVLRGPGGRLFSETGPQIVIAYETIAPGAG